MKRTITITYDDASPDKVMLCSHDGANDPWEDLALLLEGAGVLTGACINAGITEHNGQPLNKYLKSYIDKVCGDYKTLSLVERKDHD